MAGWVVVEGVDVDTQECDPDPSADIRLVEQTDHSVRYEVKTDRVGWLVMADTWYPGWRASVDGETIPVVLANQTFRAAVVPAGQHMVVLTYAPQSFSAGWIISLIASVLLVILLARRRVLRSP